MKFQVAIIGSPGSGKTVLTAVLSRYLSGHSDRVYMNPKGAHKYKGNAIETISTISYVNDTLDILHSGNWETTGTASQTKFELGFELNIGGNAYEMKLLDSAGEDLQAIWSGYDRSKLDPFRTKLFDYILSSNVVVLIVNLDHFADAPTLKVRGENENVLKEAVDNLVKAGKCHYILVCFTAYDKYKAHIDQTYGGNFINYLKGELPMFYRSCEVAARTVVRDYTEYGLGQKKVRLDCIAVAPVVAQRPAPGINPDRFGKPPVGFDIRNSQHSQGIKQMADWLYMCEQFERGWSKAAEKIEDKKGLYEFLMYRIAPIVIGAFLGVLAWLVLNGSGSLTQSFYCFIFGAPIGAGIGFLAGDLLKVAIMQKDGFFFRKSRSDEKQEEQEKSATPRPAGTGGTATPPPPRPSGTGGTSTPPPPPRPSGTAGTAATSGSETLD